MWVIEYRGYGEVKVLSTHNTEEKMKKAKKQLYKNKPPDWIRDYIWIYRK